MARNKDLHILFGAVVVGTLVWGSVGVNRAMAGQFGACCDEFGYCSEETLEDCDDFGGIYFGDGTECGDIICPIPQSGACCAEIIGCFEDFPEFCDGEFYGAGTFCGDYDCEDPLPLFGACIEDSGACTVTSQIGCENFNGAYLGDGSDCGIGNCTPGTFGGCCLPDESCIQIDATSCDTQGGVFQGAGNPCFAANCFSTLGACCVAGQPCVENTTDECASLGGVYLPNDDCVVADCEDSGACCLNDETCIETTPADCTAQSGYFQGSGLNCTEVGCTELGSCCFPDRACVGSSIGTCFDLLGGSSFVTGIDICAFQCSAYGACCRSDGHCELLLEFLCSEPGDTFRGHGEPCPDCCVSGVGACCFLNDTCETLTEPACTSLDGSFQGIGITCLEVDCINLGNCCTTEGLCIGSSVDDCFNLHGGDLWSDCGECFVPCTVLMCPLYGACCLPDGNCEEDWDFGCVESSGMFQGQGVECASVTCEAVTCDLPGDTSGDSAVNGIDVQTFVGCIVGQPIGNPPTPGCECADVDADGAADFNDVDAFVCELIGGPCT